MPIICRLCGGSHLTQQCLRERAAEQAAAEPNQERSQQRPAVESDWILPQHDELLDLLQTHRGRLAERDRCFILEGVRNGCYGGVMDGRTPFPDDVAVVVGQSYKIYIDGKLMHHGSLWTTKTFAQRQREHVKNSVKDSQAWREKSFDVPLDDVVDILVQEFGSDAQLKMCVRLHRKDGPKKKSDSVKVFIGGTCCDFCQHCRAYDRMNELLGCDAQHGPRDGWATDEMRRWASRQRNRS